MNRSNTRRTRLATALGLAVAGAAIAHADGASSITVDDAIKIAAAQHPSHDEDAANEAVADAKVDVERVKFVPDVELIAQLDRTSSNLVPGALFSAPNIPVVAGTQGRELDAGTWTTAAGATASWDALGFKRWDAAIDAARADALAVRADTRATELDVEYAAADRFLTAVARAEAVKAAQASVDRAQVFETVVKAAVDQKLRPGADLSRAEAELSVAKTALVRAETASRVSLAQLAEALGEPGGAVAIAEGNLTSLPPRTPVAGQPSPQDPRLVAAADRTEAARQRKAAVDLTTLPRINLVGAFWMRGNGAMPGGVGADGLVPDVPNWALGVVVTWPIFAGRVTAPQSRVEAATIARDQAREREVAQRVQGQIDQAQAIVDGAYQIAAETPVALASARAAESQATARYQAQLVTADDVAQAQRLLEQAETDDAVARIDVWRALLFTAYAHGDLAPFLAQVHGGG
jgi:outer membrane protein TolC